jgi:hypothetical protein
MYLLYLDESGSLREPNDEFVIMAGLAVYERQSYHLSKALDDLANECWPSDPDKLEFRGSAMRAREKMWKNFSNDDVETAFGRALNIIASNRFVYLFGAVVEKSSQLIANPLEVAFAHVCARFDMFLGRMKTGGEEHRGMIIMDQTPYQSRFQEAARELRHYGASWCGKLKNLAELPVFSDSASVRLIQAADLIAYALRMRYNEGLNEAMGSLLPKFDTAAGRCHGLVHITNKPCNCLACIQRTNYRQSSREETHVHYDRGGNNTPQFQR